MSLIGSIALRMSADPGPLKRDLNQGAAAVQSFSSQVSKTSSLVKGAFVAAIGGAGAMAIGKMISSASDLQQNVGKIGDIFGPQAKSVEADAREMADSYGVALNSMLDGAGKLGGLFKGAKFDSQATADLSKQFNRLTLDASRFYNVDYETAFQKIRSGLAGEAEPLRDFGVFLTADKIKAQALAMGLADLNGELSDTAKITATASIISNGLADAQGNAAKTAGDTASRMEEFKGRVDNLMTTLGEGLAPIAGKVLGGINTALAAMTTMWSQNKDSVLGFGKTVLDTVGFSGEGVNVFQVAIGGLATVWQSVVLAFKASQMTFQEVFTVLFDGVAEVVKVWDGASEAILGTSTGIGERLGEMAASMKDTLAEARKDFAAEMAKPWAWNVVGDQFQAARDKLKGLQDAAAKVPDAVAALAGKGATVGDAATKSKGKAHDPFGAALKLGTVEAASTVLRSRSGADASKDATAKNTLDTAAAAKEAVTVQKQILKALTPGSPLKLTGI
ncbi:hypothetical protein [Paludisphaera borealis]|uniref:Uncharacterized protein n=1 Tax=Paludisphaera borealis TaxID=1387353 RepID=A0A1U7CNH5_9BACT|nr:hypothetical protein [Paludisphaera borealis]APW60490.1 hypothetical protein BSF38_01960 [Paludisphaera borealis]